MAFEKTYENLIFPPVLANVTGDAIHSPQVLVSDEELSESDNDTVIPPSTRRPPGRLRKRRIRHAGELDREKRIFTKIDHSKRTYRDAI